MTNRVATPCRAARRATGISPEYLRAAMRYDPSTGDLWWRERADRDAVWNRRYAGRQVYVRKNIDGYLCIEIGGRRLQAHRVAWAIYHGSWPEHTIDHINRQPSDNRIENLRDVTMAENNANRRLDYRWKVIPDSTGTVSPIGDRWRAKIKFNRADLHLGHFATEAEARAACQGAAIIINATKRIKAAWVDAHLERPRDDAVSPSLVSSNLSIA